MDPCLATLNELFTTTYRSVLKVEEVMLRHLSNGSLTLSEMHMLECIGKRKGDAAITDIAQELDITPPSVTMAVKRLEKKGFITKDRSEEDGRRVRVRLTEEGRRAVYRGGAPSFAVVPANRRGRRNPLLPHV